MPDIQLKISMTAEQKPLNTIISSNLTHISNLQYDTESYCERKKKLVFFFISAFRSEIDNNSLTLICREQTFSGFYVFNISHRGIQET
jgi:hypothetical protein